MKTRTARMYNDSFLSVPSFIIGVPSVCFRRPAGAIDPESTFLMRWEHGYSASGGSIPSVAFFRIAELWFNRELPYRRKRLVVGTIRRYPIRSWNLIYRRNVHSVTALI